MNTQTTTLPRLIIERLIHESAAMNLLLIAAGSFLIAASAQAAIPVPFSPVPWTLQPLALVLVGGALGSARGAAAATLYLLEGLAGLPVFSQGHGGMAHLLGPTAGYLYAFPAAAWISGFVAERGWNRSVLITASGMFAALGVIFLGGWSWLAGPIGLGASRAFALGVAPFIPADLEQIAIAAAILPGVQALINRHTPV